MRRDLSRLLNPRSIAVVGGGAWCRQVVAQSQAMGFAGRIMRVHPSGDTEHGVAAVRTIDELPAVPDAVFLGINRHATVEAVARLSAMGAGGAVCFASGFSEAATEDDASSDLQQALVAAAGEMPILGPNCYGFVNALDGALLWPDQHGCVRVERGVAILTQSSNIAINLSMQRRGLPVAFVVTCGNMAQTSQVEIATGLLDDPRVTAIGLHVEGFGDTADWHAFAVKAEARAIPVIVLKVGLSEHARLATVSHTASVAGSDAGASALLQRLGFARVQDLPAFLCALMLAHCDGIPDTNALASISCSGGEAALVGDICTRQGLCFPALTPSQKAELKLALGPLVALSNPLDYNTYIWGDVEKMTQAWLPMATAQVSLVLVILDYPHTDATAWECATLAAIALRQRSGRPVAIVATLPELLPLETAARLLDAGVVPLHGLHDAVAAFAALARCGKTDPVPPQPALPQVPFRTVNEAVAKAVLRSRGFQVPKGEIVAGKTPTAAAVSGLKAPLVVKSQGIAHKSDAGGVRLGLQHAELRQAMSEMPGTEFLIEEMVSDVVAELLVGIVRDPAHGFVLTLGAGGVLTELWQDSTSLLLPVRDDAVRSALQNLRVHALLAGFRGAAPANVDAVIDAILALQDYVLEAAEEICEIEINPLLCTKDTAIAADVLIARATQV